MEIEYLKIFEEIRGSNSLFYHENLTELIKKKMTRSDLIRRFSFAIPSSEGIKEIIKYSPLIEIGAGNGYWAYIIHQYGGDIIAFDNNKRNEVWDTEYKEQYYKKYWFDVKNGNEKEINNYPKRTLFLSWIEYCSEMGLRCLKKYKGQYFIHVGEGEGGCCATDSFFEYLEKKWILSKYINIPQWDGIHDYLEIYKRK